MEIKEKIRDIMIERGYTIYSLSKATELSQTSIANWFNKVNNEPSISALEKVCKAFDITMAELFAKDSDTLLPCKEEFRDIYNKLLRLTPKQRHAVLVHIDSYLYANNRKTSKDVNCSDVWYLLYLANTNFTRGLTEWLT